jgi:molecular chaperone GrpE
LEQETKLAKEKKKTEKTITQKDSPDEKIIEEKPEDDVDQGETIRVLNEQLSAEKDRVLRLSAEFENYKKRKQRETDDFRKFANETVFRQLLTVVDNLERAILAAEGKTDENGLLEGVKLTHKEIIKLFETFNVKPIEAENQPFDPNFHQAVTQEETDEVPEKNVLRVLQKGYLLHDRLIRPAMVIVAKKTEKEIENNKEE